MSTALNESSITNRGLLVRYLKPQWKRALLNPILAHFIFKSTLEALVD